MRSFLKRLLLLLFACSLAALFSAAGSETARLMPVQGTVTVSGAAIRPQPTRAVPGLITLSDGAFVTVADVLENAEGCWLRVAYMQKGITYEGYMRMDYVSAELIGSDGEPIRIPVQLRVSARAECGAYNHVGYRWQKEFFIGDEALNGIKTITLMPGDTVTLSARLTELDSYPDTGSSSVTKTVTRQELSDGFTVQFTVNVAENRGRYSGSECVWTVTFRFTKA